MGLTDHSSQEQCGLRTLKLAVSQEQVVGWFETRCRRTGIRGIAFVACTSEKPRAQTNSLLNQERIPKKV